MNETEAFFEALARGDVSELRALLDASPPLVRSKKDGATALHFAALRNQHSVVGLLAERGADLDVADGRRHLPPIAWANEAGHLDMVRHLYSRGASVNLHLACAFGLLERVRELLAGDDAEINQQWGDGMPIHYAALWGQAAVVRLLLELGADPNLENAHGRTALGVAQHQVETGCQDTPRVNEERKQQIQKGCAKVIEILRARRAR